MIIRKPWISRLVLIFVIVGLGGAYGTCCRTGDVRLNKQSRFLMDTLVTISAAGSPEKVMPAIVAALDRMQEISLKFNAHDASSQVYEFNHEGKPITDKEIILLVRSGLQVGRDSGGAFEMTVASLAELWGFYGQSPKVPSVPSIAKTLDCVGHQHLHLSEDRLEKDDPCVQIDLGGIAKGYAISEAVRVLRAYGIRSALVDAGGDIFALGRIERRAWRVGVRDPRGEGLLGYFMAEDSAVMGSGDYERFFIQDGRRYHHIFDPRTGFPTQGVASVTLLFHDPVIAQPWAKVPFVLGPKRGLELLERIPGMEALIILDTGEKVFSRGLKNKLHK